MTDLKARITASEWHGGQSSPLYALASSGVITDGVLEEIGHCMDEAETSSEIRNLENLRQYCLKHGERGPQAGWSELNW